VFVEGSEYVLIQNYLFDSLGFSFLSNYVVIEEMGDNAILDLCTNLFPINTWAISRTRLSIT